MPAKRREEGETWQDAAGMGLTGQGFFAKAVIRATGRDGGRAGRTRA
ncbi:MAG: hypothetical protein LBB09_02765 [Rickettsiales bacterium]|nr:hypothetical protein [Rickettsiales bacterium]